MNSSSCVGVTAGARARLVIFPPQTASSRTQVQRLGLFQGSQFLHIYNYFSNLYDQNMGRDQTTRAIISRAYLVLAELLGQKRIADETRKQLLATLGALDRELAGLPLRKTPLDWE